jgi:hypothetical protein
VAKGNEIVLSIPKGVFLEGTLSGTPKPGTKMEIQNGTAAVLGRHTWQAYGINAGMANNDPRLTAIFIGDSMEGFIDTVAGVSGQRAFLYCPLPGEEMNVLTTGEPGTGSTNAFTVGERLQPVAGTGKYIVQNTSSSGADFIVMEHIDQVPDIDTLVWCMKQ